jgi:hypothetical protein
MNDTGPNVNNVNSIETPIASTGAGCCTVDAVYSISKLVEEEGKGVSYATPPASMPLMCRNIATSTNTSTTRASACEFCFDGVDDGCDGTPSRPISAPSSPASPANAASASAARKLAKLQRKVLAWWRSVPADRRRTHYLGAQLAQGVGIPVTTLGPALKSLGWRREQVRLAGTQVPVWCAPGAPSIKRPIGRPPVPRLAQGGQP